MIERNAVKDKVFEYLTSDIGMTYEGACGFIGNLQAESFVAPETVEELLCQRYSEDGRTEYKRPVYTAENIKNNNTIYTMAVDSGTITKEEFLHPRGKHYGYGLNQATTENRKSMLWRHTKGAGKSISDLDGQLEYLFEELKTMFPSLLKFLRETESVYDASDKVLLEYECPANAESMKDTRREYSEKYFELYAEFKKGDDKNMNAITDFSKYYGKISNSGHDERGKYSGGKAGDQTGTEWAIIPWYSRPWNVVLRYPDRTVGNMIATLAIYAANNNLVGYDQNSRTTYWEHLKASNYDPRQITVACEDDCSAGVAANVKATGYILNINALKNVSEDNYTGSLRKALTNAGFKALTNSKYLNGYDYLLPGDILLYEGHHTATNLGVGKYAENSGVVGNSGGLLRIGSTGNEVKTLQNNLNTLGYNCGAVDGIFGTNTANAVKAFQKNQNIEIDGIVGSETRARISAALANENDSLLKYGSRGDAVRNIQSSLNAIGYSAGSADGIYGRNTESAVKNFQRTYGLEVDGIVGKETIAKLEAVKKTKTVKAATTTVNVRTGAGTQYSNLKVWPTLSKGNRVDVISTVKSVTGANWYYVRIAGKYYGYVCAKYLK